VATKTEGEREFVVRSAHRWLYTRRPRPEPLCGRLCCHRELLAGFGLGGPDRYIARESVRLAHAVSVFGHQAEGVALADVLDRWQKTGDRRLWKMIISPEFGERIDLNQLTRGLMSRMEEYLGTPWTGLRSNIFNAGHLHVPVSWPLPAESAGNLFVANTTFIGVRARRADSQGHAGWVDLHGGGDGRARLLRRRRSGDLAQR